MADRINLLRNPIIAGLVLVLIGLIVAFAVNYALVQQNMDRTSAYLSYGNQLKSLSQEVSKHAINAAAGNVSSLSSLAESSSQFQAHLGYLRNGNPGIGLPASSDAAKSKLNQINSHWEETNSYVDLISGNQDAILQLKDISAVLAISMSAIQQENNKVVSALLRLSVAPTEIVLAQRQTVLVERMSRTIDKMLQASSSSLMDSFNRDILSFKRVMEGFINGDRELLLTAVIDGEIQSSLTRIDNHYRSILSGVGDITARSGDVRQIKNAADQIYAKSDDLGAAVDQLLAVYSESAGLASPMLGAIFGGSALLVILCITFLIFRETNQKMGEAAVRNEENQAAILQLLDELADLADGDLRVQATVTESFTGAIAGSINFSIDQMRALVSKINETSTQVSSAADQTQQSVGQLADASQQQAAEISDVSEAVNEMAVSIDMVSYNAAESSSVVERSVDIASNGAVVVQNTIDGMDNIRGQIQESAKRMKRLGESSQEIGDIVALINDIADRTNILSLNAAIQASMAGDAGKGFAVVADEVQRLAEQSGAAAQQISALVKTIQSDTNEAVASMEQTTAEVVQGTQRAQDAGVALGEIESVSKSLAEIIENISDAARQQAASAGKISNTMKSIQEITTQTTDGTKNTATAVGNLVEMTDELRASVTGFKLP
ncbi:MAG TPA: chemotaxis protein [Gammaproteobacteria bacterium]|nr:chemotaxis protein [Gammaproteobacteria bacterium]|tara:strand:- start:1930 stop:3930 length:2001 start_codon:yes stop_codon:yes gene_type:complete